MGRLESARSEPRVHGDVGSRTYDIAPDGSRFVIIRGTRAASDAGEAPVIALHRLLESKLGVVRVISTFPIPDLD